MPGFWESAEQRPDEVAIVDRFGSVTWGQFAERVGRVAAALRAEGLEAGDHMAMVMGNRREFMEIAMGCLFSGVIFTPVNWHLTGEEAAYVVDNCDARLFVYDELFAAAGEGVVERVPALDRVLVTGTSFEDWVGASEPAPLDPTAGTAGGAMLYSSGTTGRPKGVYRAARVNVSPATAVAVGSLLGPVFGIHPRGCHLVTGPLYHAAPLGFGSIAFHSGNSFVLMQDWSAEATLDLIAEHRVTNTHVVPTMFRRLLALPDETRAAADHSSLTGVLHGAAPCPVPVKQAMIDWWDPVIYEYYGATEGGLTAINSDEWLAKPGSVGKALPAWDVYAVDDEGERLGPEETGRIFFEVKEKGPTFEYWKDPEKTAKAHLGPGVFTLGDVGRVDDDGYVFLTDRASDMIISGGVNIYPAEVEAVLVTHPAVADAAVFGIPNEEWGEEVKAAVEVRPGHTVTADELIGFCRERLARYKCPRSVDFEEHLPRHPTGKLYKRLLRDRYWQGTGSFI